MSYFNTDSKFNPYNILANAVNNAAYIQSAASERASKIYMEGVDKNIAFLTEQNQQAQAFLAPYQEAGRQGIEQLNNLLGFNGLDMQRQSMDTILQSPEVQQQLQFGVEGFQRTAAAQGMLRSGRSVEGLFKLGQDIAQSNISQRQNALIALMQTGGNAAAGRSQLSQNLGQQVSQQNTMGSEVQSNNALMQGSLQSQAVLQTAQLQTQYPQYAFPQKSGGIGGLLGSMGAGIGLSAMGFL